MKILFWVPYPEEGASNRIRINQYLPYLKRDNIKYSVSSFWNDSAFRCLYKKGSYFKKICFFMFGTLRRILDLATCWKYDLIFIHREAYPIGGLFFERSLSLFGKPYIFDFDDAIFIPSSSHSNSFIERFKNSKRIKKIINMSSCVICGNRYLADYALKYNRNVYTIPTSIDTQKYTPEGRKEKSQDVVIGWIGSTTTLYFLNMLDNVFLGLFKHYGSNLKLKIVGGEYSLKGLGSVMSKPWRMGEEIDDLQGFDIGIMPMPDNEWTRGKCAFKAILYMSMGIPCVCSPVGVNKEIIDDGITGFLAQDENEWIKKLSFLIENPGLRERVGLEGRKRVERDYSVKFNAERFLEVINETHKGK